MLKLLLLAGIGYFVYEYMWRDNTLVSDRKKAPIIPKAEPKPNTDEDHIEDAEFTEEK